MRFRLLHFVFSFVFMHSFAKYKPIDSAEKRISKPAENQKRSPDKIPKIQIHRKNGKRTGKVLPRVLQRF